MHPHVGENRGLVRRLDLAVNVKFNRILAHCLEDIVKDVGAFVEREVSNDRDLQQLSPHVRPCQARAVVQGKAFDP